MRSLYILLFVSVISHAAAATLAAWYLFRMDQRFSGYLAWVFVGMAAEAWLAIVTMGFSPRPVYSVGWILLVRIGARLFFTGTVVMWTLYLLGYLNGEKR